MLRKAHEWNEDCKKAFVQLNEYLTNPPLLSQMTPRETLYIYLSITVLKVSKALVWEDGKVPRPVYYISHAIRGAEPRYLHMVLLAFMFVVLALQLGPYFEAYTIRVPMEAPLKKVLGRLDMSRCLVN